MNAKQLLDIKMPQAYTHVYGFPKYCNGYDSRTQVTI